MPAFNAPRPQAREETPEEKAAWLAIREHINDLALVEEQKFDLPGRITAITGAEDGGYIWKKIKDRKTGTEVNTPHLKVTAKLDDPRYAALTFTKDMKVSFFDGVLRGQPTKSPFRGMFYYIHRAALGKEPSQGIVNGTESFDTDDYVNKPMRVVFLYQGRVAQGEEYYGTRANLKVWLDHFEPTPETVKANRIVEDDGYGSPAPKAPASTSGSSSPTSDDAAPWVDDATDPHGAMAEVMGHKPKKQAKKEVLAPPPAPDPANERATGRQVKFIYAIGREAGMTEPEVDAYSEDLFSVTVPHINRRDASALIDALQRERNERAPLETSDEQLGLPV